MVLKGLGHKFFNLVTAHPQKDGNENHIGIMLNAPMREKSLKRI